MSEIAIHTCKHGYVVTCGEYKVLRLGPLIAFKTIYELIDYSHAHPVEWEPRRLIMFPLVSKELVLKSLNEIRLIPERHPELMI